jgi:hypothetical protein
MNNKIMTLTDKQNNKRIGGGFFFNSETSKKPKFVDLLKKSISSESKLINQLKKYKQLIDEYNKIYKEHIKNLDKMDGYFEDDNFNSFHKSFNVIFNKINIRDFDDKEFSSEPLVLKNYTDINSDYLEEHIIEYHILQQIQYLLDLYYPKKEDRLLFRLVSVRDVMTKPEFKVFSIENKMTDYLPLQHNKYQLDYKKMKDIFDQVLSYIKSQISVSYMVSKKKKKSTKKNEKTPKLLHKLHSKSKKEKNNNVSRLHKKIKSKKIKSKKISQKKISQKKISQKKISQKKESLKKDLRDIKLPFDEPIIPGVEINIPRKVES